MVCGECKRQRHGKCRGGTWCDCQHAGWVKLLALLETAAWSPAGHEEPENGGPR